MTDVKYIKDKKNYHILWNANGYTNGLHYQSPVDIFYYNGNAELMVHAGDR